VQPKSGREVIIITMQNLPNKVKVGSKYVGEGEPNFIIAEIGNNHNGEFELAKKSVLEAARLGADAVKFQKRTVADVFTKDMLSQAQTHSRSLGNTYGEYRQKQELKDEELAELKKLAHSLGLAFFVTPFDLKSASVLAKIGMDAWKVSSFDLNYKDLLEFVAKQNQPIFLSTGMATLEEMDEAVGAILKHNKQLIINHCVSIYPTPDEDLNLGAVGVLRERYKPLPIGYSGHEIGYIPTLAAVALGVATVERHFTLDKTLPGPDHATVSLDPIEFEGMVKQIRRIERAVSDKKIYLHEKEIKHRQKHGKSVVSKVKIPAGSLITADMLTCKSPGHGIKPTFIHTVIGKRAKVDIADDMVLTSNMLIS